MLFKTITTFLQGHENVSKTRLVFSFSLLRMTNFFVYTLKIKHKFLLTSMHSVKLYECMNYIILGLYNDNQCITIKTKHDFVELIIFIDHTFFNSNKKQHIQEPNPRPPLCTKPTGLSSATSTFVLYLYSKHHKKVSNTKCNNSNYLRYGFITQILFVLSLCFGFVHGGCCSVWRQ